MAAQSEASEGYPLLVNAINAAAAGRTDEAIHLVYEFASEHHILGFIDLFQQYVQENQDRLPVENVINFAIDLIAIAKQVQNLDSNRTKVRLSRTYRRWMWITRVLRHENKADKDICP